MAHSSRVPTPAGAGDRARVAIGPSPPPLVVPRGAPRGAAPAPLPRRPVARRPPPPRPHVRNGARPAADRPRQLQGGGPVPLPMVGPLDRFRARGADPGGVDEHVQPP